MRVTTTRKFRLSEEEIHALVHKLLDLPDDADIEASIWVPSGGDYSGMELIVGKDVLLHVKVTVVEER